MRSILLFCLCWPLTLAAQSLEGWQFGGFVGLGTNIKHSTRIVLPINTYRAWSLEGFAELQTTGRRNWHQTLNYPQVGVSFRFMDFGNAQYLGRGFGLTPYVLANFWRKERWQLFGKLGLGFGYVTRYFHPVNNPDNTAIGSHLNNNTVMALGLAYALAPQWELRLMGSFTHYSNAAAQFPNLGINTILVQLGLGYKPQPLARANYRVWEELPKFSRWSAQAFLGLGMRESSTYGGPKYPVALFSAEANYAPAPAHRLGLGMEYEWNGATQAFLRNIGSLSERESYRESTRLSVKVGEELLLGRVTLNLHIGFYISNHALQPWFSYTRLSGKYHLFPTLRKGPNPYVGLSMKAHMITAEYFSFLLGCRF